VASPGDGATFALVAVAVKPHHVATASGCGGNKHTLGARVWFCTSGAFRYSHFPCFCRHKRCERLGSRRGQTDPRALKPTSGSSPHHEDLRFPAPFSKSAAYRIGAPLYFSRHHSFFASRLNVLFLLGPYLFYSSPPSRVHLFSPFPCPFPPIHSLPSLPYFSSLLFSPRIRPCSKANKSFLVLTANIVLDCDLFRCAISMRNAGPRLDYRGCPVPTVECRLLIQSAVRASPRPREEKSKAGYIGDTRRAGLHMGLSSSAIPAGFRGELPCPLCRVNHCLSS